MLAGYGSEAQSILLPFSSLCYKVASQKGMDVSVQNADQIGGCRKGQGYLIVAVVIYQSNHISSSF